MSSHSAIEVADLIELCREKGLRRTQALESVLLQLISAERPLTAPEIAESPTLKGHCDPATIYRMLVRLTAEGEGKMPAYAKKLAAEEIDALVAYIRELAGG